MEDGEVDYLENDKNPMWTQGITTFLLLITIVNATMRKRNGN